MEKTETLLEQAMLKYPIGTKFKSPASGNILTVKKHIAKWYEKSNIMVSGILESGKERDAYIYYRDEWAEIIKESESYFKPYIVINKKEKRVYKIVGEQGGLLAYLHTTLHLTNNAFDRFNVDIVFKDNTISTISKNLVYTDDTEVIDPKTIQEFLDYNHVFEEEITISSLKEFPEEGSCKSLNEHLIKHITNIRSATGSGGRLDKNHTGIAWNGSFYWFIISNSSRKEYQLNDLLPFIKTEVNMDSISTNSNYFEPIKVTHKDGNEYTAIGEECNHYMIKDYTHGWRLETSHILTHKHYNVNPCFIESKVYCVNKSLFINKSYVENEKYPISPGECYTFAVDPYENKKEKVKLLPLIEVKNRVLIKKI